MTTPFVKRCDKALDNSSRLHHLRRNILSRLVWLASLLVIPVAPAYAQSAVTLCDKALESAQSGYGKPTYTIKKTIVVTRDDYAASVGKVFDLEEKITTDCGKHYIFAYQTESLTAIGTLGDKNDIELPLDYLPAPLTKSFSDIDYSLSIRFKQPTSEITDSIEIKHRDLELLARDYVYGGNNINRLTLFPENNTLVTLDEQHLPSWRWGFTGHENINAPYLASVNGSFDQKTIPAAAYLHGIKEHESLLKETKTLTQEEIEKSKNQFKQLGYVVSAVFDDTTHDDATDFFAVGLVSDAVFGVSIRICDADDTACTEESTLGVIEYIFNVKYEYLPPLLVLRGTDSFRGWFDDFHLGGIGRTQLFASRPRLPQYRGQNWGDDGSSNYQRVANWLDHQLYTQDSEGVVHARLPTIVGQSLGGALAQSIAADYVAEGRDGLPRRLGEVVTFVSPGIPGELSDKYKDTQDDEILPPVQSVTHHIVRGDLVSLGGEKYLGPAALNENWPISTDANPNWTFSDLHLEREENEWTYLPYKMAHSVPLFTNYLPRLLNKKNLYRSSKISPDIVDFMQYSDVNSLTADEITKYPPNWNHTALANKCFTYFQSPFQIKRIAAIAKQAKDNVTLLPTEFKDLTLDEFAGLFTSLVFRRTAEMQRKLLGITAGWESEVSEHAALMPFPIVPSTAQKLWQKIKAINFYGYNFAKNWVVIIADGVEKFTKDSCLDPFRDRWKNRGLSLNKNDDAGTASHFWNAAAEWTPDAWTHVAGWNDEQWLKLLDWTKEDWEKTHNSDCWFTICLRIRGSVTDSFNIDPDKIVVMWLDTPIGQIGEYDIHEKTWMSDLDGNFDVLLKWGDLSKFENGTHSIRVFDERRRMSLASSVGFEIVYDRIDSEFLEPASGEIANVVFEMVPRPGIFVDGELSGNGYKNRIVYLDLPGGTMGTLDANEPSYRVGFATEGETLIYDGTCREQREKNEFCLDLPVDIQDQLPSSAVVRIVGDDNDVFTINPELGHELNLTNSVKGQVYVDGVQFEVVCDESKTDCNLHEVKVNDHIISLRTDVGELSDNVVHTTMSKDKWYCGVAGYTLREGDPTKRGLSRKHVVHAFADQKLGSKHWSLFADFHGPSETWDLRSLCFDVALVDEKRMKVVNLPTIEGDKTFRTNILDSEWQCGVFGFDANNGTPNFGKDSDDLFIKLSSRNGYIAVTAEARTQAINNETWDISLLCVATPLVGSIGAPVVFGESCSYTDKAGLKYAATCDRESKESLHPANYFCAVSEFIAPDIDLFGPLPFHDSSRIGTVFYRSLSDTGEDRQHPSYQRMCFNKDHTVFDVSANPPSAVSYLTAKGDSTVSSLALNWSPVKDSGDGPITSYEYSFKQTQSASWSVPVAVNPEVTSVSIDAGPSDSCWVRVRARNGYGAGAWSIESRVVWYPDSNSPCGPNPIEPTTPTITQAEGDKAAGVAVAWTPPSNAELAKVDQYVYEFRDSKGVWGQTIFLSGLSATYKADLAKACEFRVRAVTQDGIYSPWSQVDVQWSSSHNACRVGPPSGLSANGNTADENQKLNVTWSAPDNASAHPIDGYEVEFDTSASLIFTKSLSINEYQPAEPCSVRVRTVAADGSRSIWAKTVIMWANPPAHCLIGPPRDVSANGSVEDQELIVTWMPPANAEKASLSGYEIQFDDSEKAYPTQATKIKASYSNPPCSVGVRSVGSNSWRSDWVKRRVNWSQPIADCTVTGGDVFYISATASNGGDGSVEAPFNTIDAGLKLAFSRRESGLPTTLRVHSGTYREAIKYESHADFNNQPDIVIESVGDGQVIVSGSDNWSPATGRQWVAVENGKSRYRTAWSEAWAISAQTNACNDNPEHSSCIPLIVRHREMVFFDGIRLMQVLSVEQLAPGTFYVDNTNKTLTVELPAASVWPGVVEVANNNRQMLLAMSGVHNLTVSGLTFQHAPTPWSDGESALKFAGITNLTLDNLVVRMNNEDGLYVGSQSYNVQMSNLSLDDNGRDGIRVWKVRDLVLENSSTNRNNWRGWMGGYLRWSVGNKLHNMHTATISNHESIGNFATGLWLDEDNSDINMNNIQLRNNRGHGLWLEANQGPINIHAATLSGNGRQTIVRGQLADVGYGLRADNTEAVSLDFVEIFDNVGGAISFSGVDGARKVDDWETPEYEQGSEFDDPNEKYSYRLEHWRISNSTISTRGELWDGTRPPNNTGYVNSHELISVAGHLDSGWLSHFPGSYEGSNNKWQAGDECRVFRFRSPSLRNRSWSAFKDLIVDSGGTIVGSSFETQTESCGQYPTATAIGFHIGVPDGTYTDDDDNKKVKRAIKDAAIRFCKNKGFWYPNLTNLSELSHIRRNQGQEVPMMWWHSGLQESTGAVTGTITTAIDCGDKDYVPPPEGDPECQSTLDQSTGLVTIKWAGAGDRSVYVRRNDNHLTTVDGAVSYVVTDHSSNDAYAVRWYASKGELNTACPFDGDPPLPSDASCTGVIDGDQVALSWTGDKGGEIIIKRDGNYLAQVYDTKTYDTLGHEADSQYTVHWLDSSVSSGHVNVNCQLKTNTSGVDSCSVAVNGSTANLSWTGDAGADVYIRRNDQQLQKLKGSVYQVSDHTTGDSYAVRWYRNGVAITTQCR